MNAEINAEKEESKWSKGSEQKREDENVDKAQERKSIPGRESPTLSAKILDTDQRLTRVQSKGRRGAQHWRQTQS